MGSPGASRRDIAQPCRSEGREVDRRHQRRELVVGADVRLRLAAADVLLACLERQHERAASVDVTRLAHEPARELAEQRLPYHHEPEAGSAERERVAERLAIADRDVGSVPSRRDQDPEAQRVDRRHEQRAVVVSCLGECGHGFEEAEEVRLLGDDASCVGGPGRLGGEVRR